MRKVFNIHNVTKESDLMTLLHYPTACYMSDPFIIKDKYHSMRSTLNLVLRT